MFFGSVTLISLILALITRRPVARLIHLHLQHLGFLWTAIALRLLFVPGAVYPLLRMTLLPGLPPVGGLLYSLSLLLVVLFTWFNRSIIGVAVIGLGLLLNAAVIISNGGRMPVDPVQTASVGNIGSFLDKESRGEWSTFTLMKPESRLTFLGDRIPVTMPLGEWTVVSLGDLVIAAGIFLFFLVPPGKRTAPSISPGRA